MTNKPKAVQKPSPSLPRPVFVDVVADATHQGKSLLAARIRDHFEDAGVHVVLVRIESRQVAASVRPSDVFIPTEDIARCEELPGGVVGVLTPGLEKLDRIAETGGVLVLDWAGGLGAHRLRAYAAMRIDRILGTRGVDGYSVVVTTNHADRVDEARRTLEETARIAPGLRRVLAMNRKTGSFEFPAESRAGKSVAALRSSHADGTTLDIPRIEGDSLGHLAPLGLEMKEIIARDAEEIAARLQSSDFVVMACQTHIAAWYGLTRRELERALPFRAEDRAD